MRKIMTSTFLLFLLLTTTQLFAWSDAGHKIVASLAFRSLTPEEQKKVVELLKKHPRYIADFRNAMPEDIDSANEATQDEWMFQQAAIWPDKARAFSGDLREKYHRPSWHYINLPHFLSDHDRQTMSGSIHVNTSLTPPTTADESMNVVQLIRYARTVLKADSHASNKEKALMLSWLFHTVGDIHQPLHSVALFTPHRFPQGDRGGNSIKTKQRGNLHSLWDQFPGGKVKFRAARNKAIELWNNVELKPLGEAARQQLNEETWLKESQDLAVSVVYGAEVATVIRELEENEDDVDILPIDLEDEYLSNGGAICDQRLIQAGARLGAILKSIVQ